MEEELDYTLEASNQMVFADEFANDPDFVVPRVLGNSPRVLVTSWMESEASLAQVIKDGTPEQRDHFGQLYARFLVARSEEHTSELQSLMRNSYAVFCLKKKKKT